MQARAVLGSEVHAAVAVLAVVAAQPLPELLVGPAAEALVRFDLLAKVPATAGSARDHDPRRACGGRSMLLVLPPPPPPPPASTAA